MSTVAREGARWPTSESWNTTVLHTTAILADREVLASLRSGVRGRVHSTYRSVINIATGGPELLSLTSASVVRGPRSIRLGLDRLDHYGIVSGDDVIGDGHTLSVGNALVVITAATPVWDDSPDTGPLVADRLSQLEDRLGSPSWAAGAPVVEGAIAERISRGIHALREAVLSRDEEGAHAAASSLIGLGAGVTTTGDDLLTGAAYAASRLGGPLGLVQRAVARLIESDTNDLSRTALRCAQRGRAVQPLEDLYAWLCGAPVDYPHHLVADVKAIGHTSGADLAQGLIAAVRLHRDAAVAPSAAITPNHEAAVRM